MTITNDVVDTLRARNARLISELGEARLERDIFAAQLGDDIPTATRWLQGKVNRQRAALDALHTRVVSQRFVLRTLDELGRSLSADEYRAARKAGSNEQLRDRIEDPDAK